MKRNPNLALLQQQYLFPQINQRKKEFLAREPGTELISLGIGDTTEAIPRSIVEGLAEGAQRLGHKKTYTGYGPEQGHEELRTAIAHTLYQDRITPSSIFISDGAKCDIGRLQLLFGRTVKIALQDPAYPVYRDGSLLQGVADITYLPCTPQNNFFPDLTPAKNCDLLYFCSPNNPTGAVATRDQLTELVAFARKNKQIILFDSAYAAYIQDPSLPRSIYEIDGAEEVAIETSSFSKIAGFTGVRLGWSIVPEQLKYEDGQSVQRDWSRITSTIFNGASNIAQAGGLQILKQAGLAEVKQLIAFYMENAHLLSNALKEQGIPVYGGQHAPYVWAHFPNNPSWETFQYFLESLHLVVTPGSGFGPTGEGFIRLTAFNSRENINKACKIIANNSLLSIKL